MKPPLIFAIGLIALAAFAGFAYVGFSPALTPHVPEAAKPGGDEPAGDATVCAQVITPARDTKTGDIREFPTPCDVPDGWEIIQNDIPDLGLETI